MSNPKQPVLILGAGLAGLHLAWSLYLRKHPFRIASRDFGKPAWHASAGIINPVTGKRVVKSWRIDTLLPSAIERYRAIAETLGAPSAYHASPLMRFFRGDPDEIERFNERRLDSEYAPYLEHPVCSDENGFSISQSGWVDVRAFVEESRQFFLEKSILLTSEEPVSAATLNFAESGIIWNGGNWEHVVFCEGYHGEKNPYFDWLDYRISRGDVLDFEAEFELPQSILNREKWVLPLSSKTGRTGSTYAWDNLEAEPKTTDALPLLGAWSDLLPQLPEVTITQHRVGIRSGTNDSKPYAGPHPLDKHLCILNGFGSKGASQSPWCAERLAEFLIDGTALPKDIDPARRLKFLKQPLRKPRDIPTSNA